MKINWRVRIKNPVWWVQVVIAVITPMLAYFGINWNDLTTWSAIGNLLWKAISNPVVVVTVLLSVCNTINDPTTKGLSDSESALSYNEPKCDKNLKNNENN